MPLALGLQADAGGGVPPIDLVGLGLVLLFALLGFLRGLWWQVVRLAGVAAAVLLARALAPEIEPHVAARWPELPPRLGHGAAWIAVLLGAMALAALLGVLGRRLLEAMQLGLTDRVGGLLAGALTGLVLHVAIAIAFCQLGSEPLVARVVSGSRSELLVEAVGSRFPVALGKEAGVELEELLQRARRAPRPEEPGGTVR